MREEADRELAGRLEAARAEAAAAAERDADNGQGYEQRREELGSGCYKPWGMATQKAAPAAEPE